MSEGSNNAIGCTGPSSFAIFCVFFLAKITGYIDWPWWLVTLPLWLGLAIVLGILLILGVVWLLAFLGIALLEVPDIIRHKRYKKKLLKRKDEKYGRRRL